jgi:hypothetical protein
MASAAPSVVGGTGFTPRPLLRLAIEADSAGRDTAALSAAFVKLPVFRDRSEVSDFEVL